MKPRKAGYEIRLRPKICSQLKSLCTLFHIKKEGVEMKKIGIVAVFVLCGLVGLVSCSKKDAGTDANTLYLFNWTYYTPDSVIAKFEAEYGCSVKVDSFDSNEVMYAKLKAGASGYDITFPSQDYTSIMINQGMLREIDVSKLENVK